MVNRSRLFWPWKAVRVPTLGWKPKAHTASRLVRPLRLPSISLTAGHEFTHYNSEYGKDKECKNVELHRMYTTHWRWALEGDCVVTTP